jgi:hypothetical protein
MVTDARRRPSASQVRREGFLRGIQHAMSASGNENSEGIGGSLVDMLNVLSRILK